MYFPHVLSNVSTYDDFTIHILLESMCFSACVKNTNNVLKSLKKPNNIQLK